MKSNSVRACSLSGRLPYLVEAVEDEVEPEFELRLVVAPAQRGAGVVVGYLHEHGHEVRDLVGHASERFGGLLIAGSAARIEQFLAEAQRTAAEGVQRVVDLVVGETAVSHELEQAVVVQQHGQAGAGPRLQDAGGPGVTEPDLAGGQDSPADRGS